MIYYKKGQKPRKKGIIMKTYTEHEANGLSIYVDDETGKVHHPVNWDSANQTTLYPYAYNTRSRVWDNVSGDYTLAGLKRTKRLIEWH